MFSKIRDTENGDSVQGIGKSLASNKRSLFKFFKSDSLIALIDVVALPLSI
jgi:hypothetical protein